MTSITAAIRRVKNDAATLLDPNTIMHACVQAGHAWRVRMLDPVMTLSVMMLQTLYGASCRGALRAARLDVSPTAYCQAKQRLPIQVIHRLVSALAEQAEP